MSSDVLQELRAEIRQLRALDAVFEHERAERWKLRAQRAEKALQPFQTWPRAAGRPDFEAARNVLADAARDERP